MTPVYDEVVHNDLATVQAQLVTVQAQLAATPTPAYSSSMYAVDVVSPTNLINLQVQHTATVGDFMVSAFLLMGVAAVVLKYIFNGLRGIGL